MCFEGTTLARYHYQFALEHQVCQRYSENSANNLGADVAENLTTFHFSIKGKNESDYWVEVSPTNWSEYSDDECQCQHSCD